MWSCATFAMGVQSETHMEINHHLVHQMKHIFEGLDAQKIKTEVDHKGLDAFINEAAAFAAMTGGIAGLGGAITMVVGVPVSIINTVVQQFRVTMAVIYKKKGQVTPSFEDFMKVVALSIGVEVGVGIGASFLANIAAQILVRLGVSSAGMAIPIFGAVVGAGVNFAFIKAVGETLKSLEIR